MIKLSQSGGHGSLSRRLVGLLVVALSGQSCQPASGLLPARFAVSRATDAFSDKEPHQAGWPFSGWASAVKRSSL